MMLILFVHVLVALFLCGGSHAFCQTSPTCLGKRGKNHGTAGSLTQLKPVGGDGVIPRLEPGLRFAQSRANFLAQQLDKKVTISKFSLNCLSQYAPEGTAPSPPASDLLGNVFSTATRITSSLSRYARKGLAVAAVMVTLGAFPRNVLARGHSPLKSATMVGAAFLAATDLTAAASFPSIPFFSSAPVAPPPKPPSMAMQLVNKLNPVHLWDRMSFSFNRKIRSVKERFNVDMNLMKWKNYDTLSASQRLGTTPVYFVANARGSSYIQNDAKVR